MGNLILCRGAKAAHPYYVEELGLRLYTAEELSYFIYHNIMLIDEAFIDEKLYTFLGRELGMTVLEDKLRRWSDQASLGELLLVILQDVHYYSSKELDAFKNEVNRIARQGQEGILKEKADYLVSIGKRYEAVKLYDRLLNAKTEKAQNEQFRGTVWYNRGAALARSMSLQEAARCFEQSYDIDHKERSLRKLFELTLMDGTVSIRPELTDAITDSQRELWTEDFEEARSKARFSGKALQVGNILSKDQMKRQTELKQMLAEWTSEYRRRQG